MSKASEHEREGSEHYFNQPKSPLFPDFGSLPDWRKTDSKLSLTSRCLERFHYEALAHLLSLSMPTRLAMTYDQLLARIQSHFTDGLVLVVGSGLSAAEGLPGMNALADYLDTASEQLTGQDSELWQEISNSLQEGLEAALLKHQPSVSLQAWITQKIVDLILPKEREILAHVVEGKRELRITTFLNHILKPAGGLPIVTTNYDRLIEAGCEMAGLHCDTMAIGQFTGKFDPVRSAMASCYTVQRLKTKYTLKHFPRAIVLKPHGSFDWYLSSSGPIRSIIELSLDRLIITPGLNKYQAGYDAPFDQHRELANSHIKGADRLLIVGYGFNDNHLQTHLIQRIRAGTPTLILTLSPSDTAINLALESPDCICVSKPNSIDGFTVHWRSGTFTRNGPNLWDLAELTKETML